MQGQWIGRFNGTNQGHITLNMEFTDGLYKGVAVLIDDSNAPSFMAVVILEERITNSLIKAELSHFTPINPKTLLPDTWDNVKKSFPSYIQPNAGNFNGVLSNQTIIGSWKTNVNTKGEFEVFLSNSQNQPPKYEIIRFTWEEFKKFIPTLDKDKYIFRGQEKGWRLRTSYHRSGRSNLLRYQMQDVPVLNRHVCSHLGKIFNLDNSLEYGALLNLAQHHGYPTPLLDWTRSPYIAAYFAFSNAVITNDDEDVYIFIFNATEWKNSNKNISQSTSPAVLSITPLELMPAYNPRALPQQSVTTLSSVDDIEAFIHENELKQGKQYLKVICIPAKEKKIVMNDLNYMGISAAALFPGIDGICRGLKEIHFMN